MRAKQYSFNSETHYPYKSECENHVIKNEFKVNEKEHNHSQEIQIKTQKQFKQFKPFKPSIDEEKLFKQIGDQKKKRLEQNKSYEEVFHH